VKTPWEDRLARVLSIVLSPYIVTALTATAVSVAYARPGPLGLLHCAVCIFASAVVPFAFTAWMVRTGRATDLHAAVRGQRHPIFLVAIMSTALATAFMQATGASPMGVAVGFAYCASGAVFWAVTVGWKISLHAGVMAGALVIVAHAFGPVALAGFPLLPLVGWARVRRGRHTVGQVAAGTIFGSALTAAALLRFLSP
jgi:hypothetical protein